MIPTRFIGTCEFCKRELDTREPGVHQHVSGWVMNRKGGGGHGISLPKRALRWAHHYCVDRQSQGHTGQTDILDSKTTLSGDRVDPQPTNAAYDERGKFMHVCNVCGGDGPFGVGVAIRKGDLGLWYCKTHLPTAETA